MNGIRMDPQNFYSNMLPKYTMREQIIFVSGRERVN